MRAGRFRRDERGAVAVTAAVSILLVVVLAALAIDLGALFLKSRQLQGMADLAAIAAARDLDHAQAAADATAAANDWGGAVTADVVAGAYDHSAAIAAKDRFKAGATPTNAVQVTLHAQTDLFFAAMFAGPKVNLKRTATAARADLAAFSLGSRLLAVQGGVANSLLSGLTGSQVSLSVMDYNALASADVDLLRYVQALQVKTNLKGASFDRVLSGNLATGDALSVVADLLTEDGRLAAASAARRIAVAAGNSRSIKLAALIDLGPYGGQDHIAGASSASVSVSAMDIANAVLQLANGDRQVKLDLAAGVPGLASTTVWLAIGERPNQAPWATVAPDGSTTTIRTAQTRLYIEAKVAPASGLLSGLGVNLVKLPLYIEAASAQARLSNLSCDARSATLAVSPSVGQVAIAEIDTARLNDFKTAMTLKPATLVDLLVLKAGAFAKADLGGASWQTVAFSDADIRARRTKTVSTNDLVKASLGSLLGSLSINVQLAGLGLAVGQGALTSALNQTLAQIATPLDGVVNGLTDVLGVHVGQADVRVNGLRCKDAALVA